jgi:pSer/pThr/pTyr-binding forkhead associated (FHA) protein
MEVRLVIETRRGQTKTYTLNHDETVIGRSKDAGLRVPSEEVSRRHCVLRKENGYVTVEDLQSVNGTFLNDQPVTERQIVRPGDRLQVGPVAFVVEYQWTQGVIDKLLRDTRVRSPQPPDDLEVVEEEVAAEEIEVVEDEPAAEEIIEVVEEEVVAEEIIEVVEEEPAEEIMEVVEEVVEEEVVGEVTAVVEPDVDDDFTISLDEDFHVPLDEETTATTVDAGTQAWNPPDELRDVFAHLDEIDPPKKKRPK